MVVSENGLPCEKIDLNPQSQPIIVATPRRWLILIIYIVYATLSSIQWIQYSIIANLVMVYYNVSATAVDSTSLIFMLMWPIMVFPASYIIDKTGLRVTGLIGGFATAIGACIKLFSIGRDLFYIALIGQTVAAFSQIFILSLPPKLAVTWFKPEEHTGDQRTIQTVFFEKGKTNNGEKYVNLLAGFNHAVKGKHPHPPYFRD